MNGIQFAGIANINTQKTNGVVFGGITNIMKDSSNVMSFAGIANLNGRSTMGMQFGGICNTVNGNFLGAQFAGITNTGNGNTDGAQVAGISNINNGNFTGLQLAGISNLNNGDLEGAQIGLINVSKNVSGFQFGLINVAESFENGVPFGLVNYVKKGFHALEISGGEAIYGNLAFKLGVDQLYTIYRIGYAANNSENSLTFGLGFGGMVPLTEKMKVSLDLTANHIAEYSYSPSFNLLSRADLAFRYHINDHIGFFAGPSFNVHLAENPADGDVAPLKVPHAIYEENWWNQNGKTSLWVGANAGVSFMF